VLCEAGIHLKMLKKDKIFRRITYQIWSQASSSLCCFAKPFYHWNENKNNNNNTNQSVEIKEKESKLESELGNGPI
jgi:hypothetical protein